MNNPFRGLGRGARIAIVVVMLAIIVALFFFFPRSSVFGHHATGATPSHTSEIPGSELIIAG